MRTRARPAAAAAASHGCAARKWVTLRDTISTRVETVESSTAATEPEVSWIIEYSKLQFLTGCINKLQLTDKLGTPVPQPAPNAAASCV